MIIEVTTIAHFNELILSAPVVLADFYADWCEPCKWLDSILVDVNESLNNQKLIIKINTEMVFGLTQLYQIKSVPVLIVFNNSVPVWRMNGFLTAPEIAEKLLSISRGTL